MYESIKNFNKQFLYNPEIKNSSNFKSKEGFIIVGMGGSGLAPKILHTYKPELDIIIHQDYGLPEISKETLKDKLIILSSYSGNTEEVLEAFYQAQEKKLDMVVIAVGGKLLSLANENNIPYVQLPDTGIQPRSALGFSIKAFMKVVGLEKELDEISLLAESLNPSIYEQKGKDLAGMVKDYVPVIYISSRNNSIGYNWKIKLNETGKIPSFYNVLPELNHNEMTGFDATVATKVLSDKFYFFLLKDDKDGEHLNKRMEILERLYKDRNLKVETINIEGENLWMRIFSSLVLADWVSYYTAVNYGLEAEKVPMVEEFKKLIS